MYIHGYNVIYPYGYKMDVTSRIHSVEAKIGKSIYYRLYHVTSGPTVM